MSDTTELTGIQAALRNALEQAKSHGYRPYSQFVVGAAFRGDDGRCYGGSNIENASYGVTVCAEVCALCCLRMGGAERWTHAMVTSIPCGNCRQFMSELAVGPDAIIWVVQPGAYRQFSMDQLLPFAFHGEDIRSG